MGHPQSPWAQGFLFVLPGGCWDAAVSSCLCPGILQMGQLSPEGLLGTKCVSKACVCSAQKCCTGSIPIPVSPRSQNAHFVPFALRKSGEILGERQGELTAL